MCHFQPIVLQDLFKVNVSSAFIFFSMISNFSRNGLLRAVLFSSYVFFFALEMDRERGEYKTVTGANFSVNTVCMI